jgi:cob(I)alamin adenosyltransferase
VKIYTKTGDRGDTGLFGGTRVSKASLRVEAYGDVDELNSALGVALAHNRDAQVAELLCGIQSELFDVGAELACTPTKKVDVGVPPVSDAQIETLERAIDRFEADLAPLKQFVLPGGTLEAAQLHMARTVCRRAERKLVALAAEEGVRDVLLRYLNRLSDLLFVLARHANHRAGTPDVPWQGRTRGRTA